MSFPFNRLSWNWILVGNRHIVWDVTNNRAKGQGFDSILLQSAVIYYDMMIYVALSFALCHSVNLCTRLSCLHSSVFIKMTLWKLCNHIVYHLLSCFIGLLIFFWIINYCSIINIVFQVPVLLILS